MQPLQRDMRETFPKRKTRIKSWEKIEGKIKLRGDLVRAAGLPINQKAELQPKSFLIIATLALNGLNLRGTPSCQRLGSLPSCQRLRTLPSCQNLRLYPSRRNFRLYPSRQNPRLPPSSHDDSVIEST